MAYLLDANHCIYIMNRDTHIHPKAGLHECGISQIVLGELEFGIANSHENRREQNRRSLLDFVGSIEIYELSNETTAIYGRIRANLRRQGFSIGPNDLWIAAHAIAVDLPLITHNTVEFERIPELKLDNWYTA